MAIEHQRHFLGESFLGQVRMPVQFRLLEHGLGFHGCGMLAAHQFLRDLRACSRLSLMLTRWPSSSR
jgi:hypothetical protein